MARAHVEVLAERARNSVVRVRGVVRTTQAPLRLVRVRVSVRHVPPGLRACTTTSTRGTAAPLRARSLPRSAAVAPGSTLAGEVMLSRVAAPCADSAKT